MSERKSESIIICEGYDDRAFWSGLLQHLGAKSLKDKPYVWGKQVKGRQFAFAGTTGRYMRVVPVEGGSRGQLFDQVGEFLKDCNTQPKDYIIANIDDDAPFAEEGDSSSHIQSFQGALEKKSYKLLEKQKNPPLWCCTELNGEPLVALCVWRCDDEPKAGIPNKQTLERLVSASIVAAYPERGKNVDAWLASRSDPPEKRLAKENAWSFYAGWYADHGTGDYYRAIWDDPSIAGQLKTRLAANGIWSLAEQLVNG